MKKLFAFILVFASLSVGCLVPTIGAFAMDSADNSMNHDMSLHMGMDMQGENDSNEMQCCNSPFTESLVRAGSVTSGSDDTDIDDDIEIGYMSHKSIFQNTVDRLNAPPNIAVGTYIIHKNIYISLVGIIKNNA